MTVFNTTHEWLFIRMRLSVIVQGRERLEAAEATLHITPKWGLRCMLHFVALAITTLERDSFQIL